MGVFDGCKCEGSLGSSELALAGGVQASMVLSVNFAIFRRSLFITEFAVIKQLVPLGFYFFLFLLSGSFW